MRAKYNYTIHSMASKTEHWLLRESTTTSAGRKDGRMKLSDWLKHHFWLPDLLLPVSSLMTWPTIQTCCRRKTDSFIKSHQKTCPEKSIGRPFLPILLLCSLLGNEKIKFINLSSHIVSIWLAVHVSHLILIGPYGSDASGLPSFRIILRFCHSLWPGQLGRRLC